MKAGSFFLPQIPQISLIYAHVKIYSIISRIFTT